jgi:hypothetical protein
LLSADGDAGVAFCGAPVAGVEVSAQPVGHPCLTSCIGSGSFLRAHSCSISAAVKPQDFTAGGPFRGGPGPAQDGAGPSEVVRMTFRRTPRPSSSVTAPLGSLKKWIRLSCPLRLRNAPRSTDDARGATRGGGWLQRLLPSSVAGLASGRRGL